MHKAVVAGTFVALSLSAGIYLGNHASADTLTDTTRIDPVRTTDLRHPVAAFMAPTFVTTTQEMLTNLKIQVAPEDRVSISPDPKFGLGGQLVVARALPVVIKDGTTSVTVRTWVDTVGELIKEQSIELGDNDKISPSLDSQLTVDESIVITRVAITDVEVKQSIPFSSKTQDDPTRPKGEKKTVQTGVDGQKKLTYRVTRENGTEVSRVLTKTETVKDSVQEIISIGTKPVITVSCTSNETYKNWIIDAAAKNNQDPNALCHRMIAESNGHADSSGQGGAHQGLFQYDPGFWSSVSTKAGFAGASIWDAKSQIYVTAWAWAHGYRGRWPTP